MYQGKIWILGILLILIGISSVVSIANFDSIAFFITPSQFDAKTHQGKKLRIGGIVIDGSFKKDLYPWQFSLRDYIDDEKQSKEEQQDNFSNKEAIQVKVIYKGILPDLFREGQMIVVEGVMQSNKIFWAETVLAKHDENYKPGNSQKSVFDKTSYLTE